MSDGGFDVDELIRKRRCSINLFGIVTDHITGNRVSYPLISNEHAKDITKSDESNNQESINVKSEASKNKKSTRYAQIISVAGKIQEKYKCFYCLKKERCKLEAQGLLDLCKELNKINLSIPIS